MMDTKKEHIYHLQKHLCSLRKIAGWTAEDLGDRIGVTKQTVSNLENFKTSMTLTQYIAIRTVIDYEIKINNMNIVLPQVVELLLNKNEDYTDAELEELSESVKIIAATAAGGITGTALSSVSVGLLGGILGLPVIVAGISISASSFWLSKVLKNKNEKMK